MLGKRLRWVETLHMRIVPSQSDRKATFHQQWPMCQLTKSKPAVATDRPTHCPFHLRRDPFISQVRSLLCPRSYLLCCPDLRSNRRYGRSSDGDSLLQRLVGLLFFAYACRNRITASARSLCGREKTSSSLSLRSFGISISDGLDFLFAAWLPSSRGVSTRLRLDMVIVYGTTKLVIKVSFRSVTHGRGKNAHIFLCTQMVLQICRGRDTVLEPEMNGGSVEANRQTSCQTAKWILDSETACHLVAVSCSWRAIR
jgi:hypothetical protein